MQDKAEEPKKKAPGKAEKSEAATDAAPARTGTPSQDDEYTYQQMVDSSEDLFGVRSFVVVGAAKHAGFDLTQSMNKTEMQRAIEKFLEKEVETDA